MDQNQSNKPHITYKNIDKEALRKFYSARLSGKAFNETCKILYVGTSFQSSLLYPFLDCLIEKTGLEQKIQVVTVVNSSSYEVSEVSSESTGLFQDQIKYDETKFLNFNKAKLDFCPNLINEENIADVKKTILVDFSLKELEKNVIDKRVQSCLKDKKFDFIFCFFENHFDINWRVGLLNILPYLKKGGDYVFADITGSFEMLDGNFKHTYPSAGLETILKKLDNNRTELHYWKPEISVTNYKEMRGHIGRVFDKIIDSSESEQRTSDKGFFKNADLLDLSKAELKSVINHDKLNYFRYGVQKNGEESLAYKQDLISGIEDLNEIQTYQFNSDLQIYWAKGFKKRWLKGLKPLEWDFSSLLKDLQQINDNNLASLGRKALDVLASHDMILPNHTKYLALIEWTDPRSREWEYPIHFLINTKPFGKALSKKTLNEQVSAWYNTEKSSDFSVLERIFQKSKRKNLVKFVCLDPKKFENLMRKVEDPDHKGSFYSIPINNKKLLYNIKLDRKGNAKGLNVYFKYQKVRPKKSEVCHFNIDHRPMIKDKLTRYSLSYAIKTEKDLYQGSSSTRLHPALREQYKTHEIQLFEILGVSDHHEMTKLLNILIQTHFHNDACVNFQLSFFPSAIIENEGQLKEGIDIEGLGGMIVYEKYIEDDEPELKNLQKARSRALTDATNLIFYKASIASHIDQDFKRHARKAAIAAINARNSSHVIGSHVLPDIINNRTFEVSNPRALEAQQIFFRYLMRRGEYIAQLTSEFPTWSVPTWFGKELMAEFYKQHCLLEGIASSEGVKSYTFSDDNNELFKEIENLDGLLKENEFISGFVDGNDLVKDKNRIKIECEDFNDPDKSIKDKVQGRKITLGSRNQPIHHKLVLKISKRCWFAVHNMETISTEPVSVSRYMNKENVINIADEPPSEGDGETRKLYYGILVIGEKCSEIGFLYLEEGKIQKGDAEEKTINYETIDNYYVIKLHFSQELTPQIKEELTMGRRAVVDAVLSPDGKHLREVKLLEISSVQPLVCSSLREPSHNVLLNSDIQVRIPGGITGYHAFYIILENVIRNAAKHDWYKLPEEDRWGRNLEVNIELEEKEINEEEFFICKVWTNCTQSSKQNTNKICLNDKESEHSLRNKINGFLKRDIISSKGEPVKEHLGISEIKLNATFLYNKSLDQEEFIGGNEIILKDKEFDLKGHIKASEIWELEDDQIGQERLVSRLGYRFKLLKPKEVLIISDKSNEQFGNFKIEELNKNSVEVLSHFKAFEKENRLARLSEKFQFKDSVTSGLDYEFCVIVADEDLDHIMDSNVAVEKLSLYGLLYRFIQAIESEKNSNTIESEKNSSRIFDMLCDVIEAYPYRLFLLLDENTYSGNLFKKLKNFIENDSFKNIYDELIFIRSRFYFLDKKDVFSFNDLESLKNGLYEKWLHLYQISSDTNHNIIYKLVINNENKKTKNNENIKTVDYVARTLPVQFRNILIKDEDPITSASRSKNGKNEHDWIYQIIYERHFNPGPLPKDSELPYYAGSITGKSQNFFRFFCLNEMPQYLIQKSINFFFENALSIIMVIDERLLEFMKQHQNNVAISRSPLIKNIIIPYEISLGSTIIYERSPHNQEDLGNKKELKIKNAEGFDISIKFVQPELSQKHEHRKLKTEYLINTLIIHQSFLTKIAGENTHNRKKNEEALIKFLKVSCRIPSIIICTGRGRVSYNNYRYAKYVPFSIIESSLMSEKQDKLSLMELLFKTLN